MSNTNCQSELDAALFAYHACVALSLAMTVGVGLSSRICLRQRLQDLAFRKQFYGCLGTVKMIFAVVIFAIVPQCPSGCFCRTDTTNLYVYPVIAFLVGIRWVGLAHTTAIVVVGEEDVQMVQAKGDYRDVPTVEVETV